MNLNVPEDTPNVRLVTCSTPTFVGETSMYKNCNLVASIETVELRNKKKLHLNIVVGSHINGIGNS